MPTWHVRVEEGDSSARQVDEPSTLPIAELYEAYAAWRRASGRYAESAHGFARDLKAAFPQLATGRAVVPDGRVRTYRGVRLRLVHQ